jgi:hypothetical protein
MNRHTSLDDRKFIERLSKEGKTSEEISKQIGISIWAVRKWRQRLKKGAVYPRLWVAH